MSEKIYQEDQPSETQALVLLPDRIVVARFTKTYPLVVRLDLIAKVENRMGEVAFLTKDKAPELLSLFNVAWRDLHELTTLLQHELDLAKDNLTKTRGRVLLDVVLPMIKEKDLPGAKDIRDALVDADSQVQMAGARVYEISCVKELLSGKLKAIEMTYTSIKKIMGEGSFNYSTPNSNLSAGGKSSVPVGRGDDVPSMAGVSRRFPGFGRSRD